MSETVHSFIGSNLTCDYCHTWLTHGSNVKHNVGLITVLFDVTKTDLQDRFGRWTEWIWSFSAHYQYRSGSDVINHDKCVYM